MISKHYIDMNTYPRKAHFDYFMTLVSPHVGVTVDVDVTKLVTFCKERGYSFYLTIMHAVALAADRVPELRQRIDLGKVVEYEMCPTSHTESKADGTYCYCTLKHNMPFDEYITYAVEEQKKCRESSDIAEDEDVLGEYFISCLPWFNYSSFVQPTGGAEDSNPRFTWGKYAENFKGQLMLPMTILAHHALLDGSHIAKFYEYLDQEIADICK